MSAETTVQLAQFLAAHAQLLDALYAVSGAEKRAVPRDDFAAALYRSATHRFGGAIPDPASLETYLRGLHLQDLAVVCSLQRGSEPAWSEFVSHYRPILYAAARAISPSAGETHARDLADSLYAELYGLNRSNGQRNRSLLDYFHGRSKLSTWLRTVLAQRHVDWVRAARRTNSLDTSAAFNNPAASPPRPVTPRPTEKDPEFDAPDRARLLPLLQRAVSSALASLPASDRLLLSLYYLQGLKLAQIARLHGVHESSVSRQLDRVRADLREGLERRLATPVQTSPASATPGLSPAEVEACLSYAFEDASFDLARELRGPPSHPGPLGKQDPRS